jgi:hypothetical protein
MRWVLLAILLSGFAPCSPAAPPAVAEPFKDEVATFRIVNDADGAVTRRIVSFGQVFRRGQVTPNSRLAVKLGGAVVRSQMDAKALYPDGSVRHAIITVQAPGMTRRGSLDGVIAATVAGQSPTAAAPPRPAPDIQLALTFHTRPDRAETFNIDLRGLAQTAAGRDQQPWLDGPLVRERRYASHGMHGVQVVFDVWTPAVGAPRVDVSFHNDTAQNPDISTQVYDASLSIDGTLAYRVKRVAHYSYATWHKVICADKAPPPRIMPDLGVLVAVGAVPHYALFQPDRASAAEVHRLATRNDQPLGSANITPYMPTGGGRPDIGPLPAWAVFYLLDPSRENQETLLANADAAGSIPWHVRDMRTGGPINIDQHPEVWLDGRGAAAPGVLGRRYEIPDTRWQPDDAHQPSLTYLPYLLTGSQYYRDELAMQAGFDLLSMNPEYRGGAAGVLLGSQVRAVAWSLRTLANAAYILPSDSPLPRYFEAKLQNNLHEIVRRYVKGDELAGAGDLRGYLPGAYVQEGATPPWQSDYLVIVLGWIDSMGYPQARTIMAWMTNFVAGRFTNDKRGYDPIYGTPYFLVVVDPKSKRPFTTWPEAFKATFDPVRQPVTTLDYPDWGGGYAALARASLASIINATGSAQAREAYGFVKAQTPRMDASYPREPAFAIALATALKD